MLRITVKKFEDLKDLAIYFWEGHNPLILWEVGEEDELGTWLSFDVVYTNKNRIVVIHWGDYVANREEAKRKLDELTSFITEWGGRKPKIIEGYI